MNKIIAGALLAAGLCGVAGTAPAQTTPQAVEQHQQKELARGEPARWLKGDGTTQAQIATKRKEIGAALNEALSACKQAAGSEHNACVRQARDTYARDMANIDELVTQSNALGGVYETAGPSE